MVNYANGKIYKIVSDQIDKCYVGSTTKKYLSDRMGKHRTDYRRHKRGTMNYLTSFEIMKYDDAKIVLLECHPCVSKDELHARERHYIESLDCVNKRVEGRTRKEIVKACYENNKEKRLRREKENRINFREYRMERCLCECGRSYRRSNKSTISQKSL